MVAESIYEYGAIDLGLGCTFCEQFLDRTSRGVSGQVFGLDFEREIYEDEHFVVVAALGQIVEGWLLIIPRVHYTSISAFPEQIHERFSDIVDRVRLQLRRAYGRTILFEHGSVSQQGTAGACIEHAHLHFLPFSLDIRTMLPPEYASVMIPDLTGLWSSPPKQDYLFYQAPNYDSWVIQPNHPLPCQYFRRLIATAAGRPTHWDWRKHIGVQTVRAVTEALRGTI